MAEQKKTAAEVHAAERRADHVRALEEERVGYERRGLKDRVAQVDAELKRIQGVKGRQAPPADKADADAKAKA